MRFRFIATGGLGFRFEGQHLSSSFVDLGFQAQDLEVDVSGLCSVEGQRHNMPWRLQLGPMHMTRVASAMSFSNSRSLQATS